MVIVMRIKHHVRGDGNGGYVISKRFLAFVGLLGLLFSIFISMITASMSYAHLEKDVQYNKESLEKIIPEVRYNRECVAVLETKVDNIEKTLVRIEGKIDNRI